MIFGGIMGQTALIPPSQSSVYLHLVPVAGTQSLKRLEKKSSEVFFKRRN